jgi:hypothetical protein
VFDHAPDICHACGTRERARAAAAAEKWRLRQAERLIAEAQRKGALNERRGGSRRGRLVPDWAAGHGDDPYIVR